MSHFFPGPTDRTAVIGRTGSGKTQFSAWLLSHMNFHEQPWIIIDYKYDELLNSIDGVQEFRLNDKLPKKPGLYIVHPLPQFDDEGVDTLFRRIWGHEDIGVYIDEAPMVPNYRRYSGYQSLLTQGRSKHIPVISVTQRPCNVSPYTFTEADYFAVFHLSTERDKKTVESFTPLDMEEKLGEYHSHWYDVKKDRKNILAPVRESGMILARINERLAEMSQKKSFFSWGFK